MRPNTITGLAATTLLGLSVSAVAATQDSFSANTTSDLVALCSAESSDPMMTAAVNWCHGFMVGTYRVLASEELKERHKAFCVPNPTPDRNTAIAQFISWAKANPARMAQSPSDSVLLFLESSFPCTTGKGK
jgi:hypothetical protein